MVEAVLLSCPPCSKARASAQTQKSPRWLRSGNISNQGAPTPRHYAPAWWRSRDFSCRKPARLQEVVKESLGTAKPRNLLEGRRRTLPQVPVHLSVREPRIYRPSQFTFCAAAACPAGAPGTRPLTPAGSSSPATLPSCRCTPSSFLTASSSWSSVRWP